MDANRVAGSIPLSCHPSVTARSAETRLARRVEMMGLEPTTPCLQSRCSSQLSYIPDVCPTAARHSGLRWIADHGRRPGPQVFTVEPAAHACPSSGDQGTRPAVTRGPVLAGPAMSGASHHRRRSGRTTTRADRRAHPGPSAIHHRAYGAGWYERGPREPWIYIDPPRTASNRFMAVGRIVHRSWSGHMRPCLMSQFGFHCPIS